MGNSGERKHVSFATQLIAGGSAGAMEAVSRLSLSAACIDCDLSRCVAMLSTSRHHQGPHAAVQEW